MSNGTLSIIIIIVAFVYFGMQFGSSRGPGSIRHDLINLGLLVVVGFFLWMIWASPTQMIPGGH